MKVFLHPQGREEEGVGELTLFFLLLGVVFKTEPDNVIKGFEEVVYVLNIGRRGLDLKLRLRLLSALEVVGVLNAKKRKSKGEKEGEGEL